MKFIAGLCAAMAISTAGVFGSVAADAQTRLRPEEVALIGCIRAWKPAPDDVTRQPTNDRPGVAGVFLLTPLQSSPTTMNDVPTYLLTPTLAANFTQHLVVNVEVIGVAQTAPLRPTVQEIITAPPRPENRPDADSLPRLTVTSLRKISDNCP